MFTRIAENTAGYAPAGLPTAYRVVDDGGGVSDPNPARYESADQRRERARLLDRAQHHVFWRRVLYYLFVLVTVALFLLPYYRPAIPGAEPDGWLEESLGGLLGWLPALLPGFLSASARWWTEAWTQSAPWFLGLAAIYGFLLWHSRRVDANAHRLSEIGWWHVKRCPQPKPPTPPVRLFERLAARLRDFGWLKGLRRFWITWLIPGLTLAAVAGIILGAIYRVAVYDRTVGDGICDHWLRAHPEQVPPEGSREITVDPNVPCVDTGMRLAAGQAYRVRVRTEGWKDASLDADLRGLSHFSDRLMLTPVIPARRQLSLPWFTLVAEIGRDSGHALPFTRESFVFTPSRDGRLFLYVNDAIDSFGEQWDTYYQNNLGSATVTVTPID